MDKQPNEYIKLDNEQVIEIYDESRKIAADTWLVAVNFIMKIKIGEKLFKDNKENIDCNKIIDKLGDEITYKVRQERNFIDDNIKEDTLKDIKTSFINTKLKYLSHPEFALKYVLKKYNEK